MFCYGSSSRLIRIVALTLILEEQNLKDLFSGMVLGLLEWLFKFKLNHKSRESQPFNQVQT